MELELNTKAVDGARLAYRIIKGGGKGKLIVMIHGLASNLTRWTEFIEHTTLAKDWDLLRIDLRGHGSSMCRGKISHSLWVNDLYTILEQEGCKQALIIGHSLGAQVGLHFAHTYPEKTAGLILIDPIFPDCLTSTLATAKHFRFLIWMMVRIIWLANSVGLYRRTFPILDLKELDRSTRNMLKNNSDMDIAELYARPLSDIKNLPLGNYLQDVYELIGQIPELSSIHVPTLALLSKGVGLSSIEKNTYRIKEMPNAQIKVIDADHWLLTERPEEARHVIESWCANLA
jgi:pimeloyl-ACP methyl ester carboxylesterase